MLVLFILIAEKVVRTLLSLFVYLELKECLFSIYFLSTALLQPKGNSEIITHMAKLVDSITVSVITLSETSNYVWIGVLCHLILVFNTRIGVFCQVPMARASILWLLGEYSERVPKVAPDVLRKMAKSFGSEVRFMMHLVSIAQSMHA